MDCLLQLSVFSIGLLFEALAGEGHTAAKLREVLRINDFIAGFSQQGFGYSRLRDSVPAGLRYTHSPAEATWKIDNLVRIARVYGFRKDWISTSRQIRIPLRQSVQKDAPCQ